MIRGKIKLSEIIAVWDILHVKNTGEIGYFDLQDALEKVGVKIENDCLSMAAMEKQLKEVS